MLVQMRDVHPLVAAHGLGADVFADVGLLYIVGNYFSILFNQINSSLFSFLLHVFTDIVCYFNDDK